MDEKEAKLSALVRGVGRTVPKLDSDITDAVMSALPREKHITREWRRPRIDLYWLPAAAAICLMLAFLIPRMYAAAPVSTQVEFDNAELSSQHLTSAQDPRRDSRSVGASERVEILGAKILGGMSLVLCILGGVLALLGSAVKTSRIITVVGTGLALLVSVALALQSVLPSLFLR